MLRAPSYGVKRAGRKRGGGVQDRGRGEEEAALDWETLAALERQAVFEAAGRDPDRAGAHVVGHAGAHRPALLRGTQELAGFRRGRQPMALVRSLDSPGR